MALRRRASLDSRSLERTVTTSRITGRRGVKAQGLAAVMRTLARLAMTTAGDGAKATAYAGTPFVTLASFNHGSLFAGRFTGRGSATAMATSWFRSSRARSMSRC